jgi:endonuclease YncB( thermonuclease family)
MRVIAICTVGDVDLSAWMVAQGWAILPPEDPRDYASQESNARAQRRGLWAGNFTAPWTWRAQRIGHKK